MARRRMAVRNFRRAKKKFTIPLAIVAGFIPLGSDIWTAAHSGTPRDIPNTIVNDITGINMVDPQHMRWQWDGLKRGTLPILGGFLIHKLAGSVGLNRTLARAGVPFIRI